MSKKVGEMLDSLEYRIRNTFDNGVDIEKNSCAREINSITNRIENLLNEYRVGNMAQTDSMRQDLKERLDKLKVLVEDTRDEEKRSTVSALQTTSIELERAVEDLERFDEEGIELTGQGDYRFGNEVEQVVNEETQRFIEKYGIKDEFLQDKIISEMRSLKVSLNNTHEKITVRMKEGIKEQVNRIGHELVEEKEKQKDEKSQSSDFASKLQAGVVSTDEIAEKDASTLSENEKAFKGNEEPNKSTREALEAQFK